MRDKFIALIFGLLALGLELGISVKRPSVESITATAFALVIVIAIGKDILKEWER